MSAFEQATNGPSVFVETSTIKLSTDSRTFLRPRKATFMFGPKEYTVDAYDLVEVNPNDKIKDSAFRAEIDLLVRIADLAAAGEIELLTHSEVAVELAGVTTFGRRRTRLADVPMRYVPDPFEYSRVIAGPAVPDPSGNTWKRAQVEFLLDIEYPRFLELRKICGANQGSSVNENQLIDAFHIWCAEEAGATYFLTCDLKLRNLIRNRTQNPLRLELVGPSELLAALGKPT